MPQLSAPLLVCVCAVLVGTSGCITKNELVEVVAVVKSVEDSEGNSVAKFSGGMYQQFSDVVIEILEPEKYAGRVVLVKVEDRFAIAADFRLKTPETKINCSMLTHKILAGECLLDDMHGYYFPEDPLIK